MKRKQDNQLRIMTKNIRTFPLEERDVTKYDMTKRELIEGEYDFIGLTETNINWRKINEGEQPHDQMRTWWRAKTIQKAWLKTTEPDSWQQGGVMGIATHYLASHVKDKGEDEKQMGRWAWITFINDDHTVQTTIITIYFPNRSYGPNTTFSQQHDTIRANQPIQTPDAIDVYYQDLATLLDEKTQDDNQVIIMGDFNADMNNENNRMIKLLKSKGLHDPIKRKHGILTSTYEYGDRAIDTIYCSDTIRVMGGGHLEGTDISDHKTIWIDIDKTSILGNNHQPLRPTQRKLRADHPGVRQRFNKELEKILHKQGAVRLIQQLKHEIQEKNQEGYQTTYEKLDTLRRNAIRAAETKCVKE